MLKPEKMIKVSVVGPRDYFEKVSEILYDLNALHIEDPIETEYFKLGEPFEKASGVSRRLVQLRSILSYLKLDPEKYFPKRKFRVDEIAAELDAKLEEYRNEVGAKIDKIKELQEKLKALEEELKVLEPLKTLGIPPKLLKGYKTIRPFVGFVRIDPRPKIKEITDDFLAILKDYGKEYVVAVFVKVDYAEDVFRVLQECGFREVSIPDIEDFDARINEIKSETSSIQEEIKRLESEIEETKAKEADLMLAIEEYLSMELEKSELPLRSLVSKYAFVTVGYVPAKDFEKFKSRVESETNGKVAVEVLEDKENFNPPTKLTNPAYVRDFEVLSTTYAIPKYHEIDPTWIMSIFFPLFFGLMLGDIGYGAIITAISLYLKRIFKTEGWQRLLNIGVYSGIASIIFGFIYGECFGPFVVGEGLKPHEVHWFGDLMASIYAFNHGHPIFDRVEAFGVKALLFITLVIGMFKLLWGFALGFRNVAVEHGIKEAVLEKGCWFLGVLGLSFIIFGFAYNLGIFTAPPPEGFGKLLPDNLYVFGPYTVEQGRSVPLPIPGLVKGWEAGVNIFYLAALPLLIVWFILFAKAEIPKMGAMGIIMGVELLTWFGQILSFARLLAIGLASVYFAYVFNYLTLKMAFPPGMAILPVAIIVLLLGHLINLILGILDPGLQSLRLHYVEFFTKFFEGGGVLYKPFGRIRKFLE
ncbi:V-type ATP synthase subunit I [Archaeoglobus profundus]|uniref:A-type ATP synthase subunit I n=1 Tax=Archaeoglobus profundus (strain DSM 5631 / JCM 9629 / NBRC 100127 / Av18) TaxID=572546 RepID=D2REZ1_ARCPA|nr:V-type ATP synthase subunit I [Archaeoglobus profundus]ADB58685.1 V-type ATPase 116 kDa subunit [Archaeoglobus profundus DSM 5631]